MNKAVLIFVWALASLPLAAQPVDVYLLAGQSNMQGAGKLANAPASFLTPITNARFWSGDEFVTLEPGKTQTGGRPGEFGPELGLARAIAEARPGRKIYVVKFARSGQPLHHGWNGNKWASADPAPGRKTFYPGEDAGDPNTGVHYRDMLEVFGAALSNLRDEGVDFRVAGFAWMQGEQDSKNVLSAEGYAQSLKRLHRRLREDLGVDRLLFVFGQVLPHAPALERFTHRVQVRQSMANADCRSGHADAIPDVYMVSTDGLPLLEDTVHYDAEGQIRLGSAFGRALLDADRQ